MTKQNSVHTIYSDDDIKNNRGYAVISYIWFLFLIPLILRRESPFAQYHAKQGLFLTIAWFVSHVLQIIPIFGQLLALLLLIINIVAIIKAWNGEAWRLPYISDWADKLNL